MGILQDWPDLVRALSQEMTPKFLVTRSAEGTPNVVPCTSIMPAGDLPDRLILGNFLLRKSVANLDADPRACVLVMTTDLEGWILQADFVEWQRTGAYVDRLNSTDLLRYNAYTGIRNAGLLDVRRSVHHFRLSRPRVLADYVLARLGRRPAPPPGSTALPLPARERFRLLTAVRVLAFVGEEGTPWPCRCCPCSPPGRGCWPVPRASPPPCWPPWRRATPSPPACSPSTSSPSRPRGNGSAPGLSWARRWGPCRSAPSMPAGPPSPASRWPSDPP
jgi:hypothetical protein